MRKLSLTCLLFILFVSAFAQINTICVLDLTSKNSESTKGNLFSLEHLLHSAGYSYTLTDSVNLSIKYKIVFTTSNLESTTFNSAERDSLINFVKQGGVLVSTNNKDNLLNSCFGISATSFNYTRFYINFKTNEDALIFKYFDDINEKQIRLGDTADYTSILGTRAFTPSTADTLAQYETDEVAATHNNFFNGHTYMLGTQYKEVILRAQVKQDYGASRAFSNNFEPAQDVYVLFISGIIKKHLPYAVNKHTAPCGFKSALVITHDVDATTSMEYFDDYANYERTNNIRSTYLITTHYVHDGLAKNFFDGFEGDIKKVYEMGHDIQSHSVSHVPDFDDESIVPKGSPGNTKNSYQPYYNGTISSNVTVFGEAEVSRDLLKSVTGREVTAFRPGYLAFNKYLINVLDSLNYKFSTSHSANDVMTAFPFFSHTDLSMNGKLTKVLEIPNTISDVFTGDPMSENNFYQKADIWKNVFTKYYNNHTNCVLLVHPTRYYKLYTQQLLVQSLPTDACITNLSDYGNYWLNRNETEVTTSIVGDTLYVNLSKNKQDLHSFVSFVVNNGRDFSKIEVQSLDAKKINFTKSNWENNSLLLHNDCERPNYNLYSITEKPEADNIYVFPNPSDETNAWLHIEVMEESCVDANIYDMRGILVYKLLSSEPLLTGVHNIHLPCEILPEGAYGISVKIDGDTRKLKWIHAKSR